ncbi:MAG: methyltransferase domain-containing protein, partial [Nitrospirales bacterium]
VTKMKQDWDRRAKHNAKYWIATEDYQNEEVFSQSGEVTAKAILSTLGPYHRTTWSALDIGCGIGRVLRPLASHFRQVVGVDVSAEMINKSKAWLQGVPNAMTFETSGVDLSLFPPCHFDFVYSYVAFQHMPRPVFDRYLEEINRVLKLQGFLAFQIPIGHPQDAPLDDTIAVRHYEYDDLKEKLVRNGLALLKPGQSEEASPVTMKETQAFHPFLLAKKVRSIRPEINVGWLQAECQNQASFLDTHLYLAFAEDCLHQGHAEKAIQTYENLLEHNPSSLEAWLQLATVLIDSGKIDEAISRLTDFTHTHPDYLAGHQTLNDLIRQRQRTKNTPNLSA